MWSTGSRLLITTELGLHALSGDGTSIGEEVWPHPRTFRDTNAGIGSSVWRAQLWCPTTFGLYSISDYQGYLLLDTNPSPGNLLENDSPVNGKVTCFAGDDFYGYAVLRNDKDSKSYLLSYNQANGSWHPLLDLGDITARHMWVSDVGHATNPTLYFNAGTDIRYIVLPRNSPNPLQDASCRYDLATTNVGKLYFSRFHGSFPFEMKAWLTGKILGEAWAAAQTVTVEYRTTDDGVWQALDTYITDPVGQTAFSTSVASRFLELRVTHATTDASVTPIWRAILVTYAVRFPFKRLFTMAVKLGSQLGMRNMTSPTLAATFKSNLKTAISSSTPIEFVNIDRDETLDVIPVDYRVFSVDNQESGDLEYVGYAEVAEHQATIFGTWARAAAMTWSQTAAFTWADLANL